MAKAELKTKENEESVLDFLNRVDNSQRKEDAFKALKLLKKITKEKPKMWGSSIIGFGKYHYKYESGREGEMLKAGFSPRKNALTFYIMSSFTEYPNLIKQLGKCNTSKACLYITKWEHIDENVLIKILTHSWNEISKKYN